MTPEELPLLDADVPIDLDNCAREPIRIPGSIQPRGVLLAVRGVGLIVEHVSANLPSITDRPSDTALGQPLADVLGAAATAVITRAMTVFGDLEDRNPVEVALDVGGHATQYDVLMHRAADGLVLLELEVADGPRPFSFPNTYRAARRAVADLNRAATLDELYEITAEAVQSLTGFDRVMVYRYDPEFNGEVVAEVKRDDLEPFLGLHYPASDIPAQARALYEQSWLRLISDVGYQPVPISPVLRPSDGEPLDLSMATLRSVSPIHIEYLQNMGVTASMSISLLRHGTLWGLIACHHYSGPHTPPYGTRAAAEFLGSTLSLRLVDRAEDAELRARLETQATLDTLTAAVRSEPDAIAVALLAAPTILDLIPADGAVVAAEGFRASHGEVPHPEVVEAVVEWARSTGEDVVATDCLSTSLPNLAVSPALASGAMVMTLPEDQHLVWFRAEAVQQVDWSGDPRTKAVAAASGEARIGPRTSFDRWRETVRLRSAPWTEPQREIAAELRRHVVEALYTRAQRDVHLAETLQRSLLPAELPGVEGWSISAFYEPAEGKVGGDWYDALTLPDGTVAVVLGDVAGHGIAAAGTMAELRNVLRAHLIETGEPERALVKLNDYLSVVLPDAFATAVIACIDPGAGLVRVASAGHVPPYLIGSDRAVEQLRLESGPPLGLAGGTFSATELVLAAGQGLVLYSDGLVERRAEDIELSIQQFAIALGQLDAAPTAAAISTARAKTESFDDVTIVSVHRLTNHQITAGGGGGPER